jgi:hypothetical protein
MIHVSNVMRAQLSPNVTSCERPENTDSQAMVSRTTSHRLTKAASVDTAIASKKSVIETITEVPQWRLN